METATFKIAKNMLNKYTNLIGNTCLVYQVWALIVVNKLSALQLLKIAKQNIWDKVFKNRRSKICGRQPL